MFFLDFGNSVTKEPFQIIGASPEMHVRLEGQTASIHPIAGTRARGKNLDEDILLSKDLLSDPKELAEHVMLVDLARNDLGRVCSYGSVKVTKMMEIENYSHVMHIVSNVEGELYSKYDCFDLLRATFPAGTVSGAPKIRAMQIISELEPDRRGPYAGAVGYFSFDGSMDTCITIRTLVMKGNEISVQAGAGIVADSIPENEYQESIHKAQALALAVEMAENFEYRVRKI
jgi:anthranilate synthase component 1